MKAPTLTVAEAADALDVAPARVRALLASGVLTPLSGEPELVLVSEVADVVERGGLRPIDLSDVEGAVRRAIDGRLPTLLQEALDPVSSEVALAVADVEISTRELLAAQEGTRVAQAQLAAARERILLLERQIVALQQPAGLFRRRRRPVALPV